VLAAAREVMDLAEGRGGEGIELKVARELQSPQKMN
jgi:hypothetical protein